MPVLKTMTWFAGTDRMPPKGVTGSRKKYIQKLPLFIFLVKHILTYPPLFAKASSIPFTHNPIFIIYFVYSFERLH
jgi:hypothetical protein